MESKKHKSEDSLLHLHDVFKIVGDQLNSRDVRVLKLMYNGIFTPEFLSHIHDGFSFLMALEKIDRVDESNFKNVENYLRMINRHDLFQYLTLRRRKTVFTDPVTQYLEQCSNANTLVPFSRKSDSQSSSTLTSCDNATPCDKNNASSEDGNSETSPPTKSSCLKRQHETETPNGRENQHVVNSKRHKSQAISCSSDGHGKSDPQPADPGSSSISSPIDSTATCSSTGRPETADRSSPPQNCVKSRKTAARKSPENVPRRRSERLKRRSQLENPSSGTDISFGVDISGNHGNGDAVSTSSEEQHQKKKITCDIRLRVRAEYVNHQAALQGNVHSNKPEQIERQFEKFMQANTILKSRDLGSIICDIKFSELTYLDAFWRDYINGSLLEALKGVFITESLKQAVGHEAIKLLVNVDEDDYESGRLVLLNSLKNGAQ